MSESFSQIEFGDFHRSELPQLLAAGNGALAAEQALAAGPLAFRLPSGEAFTYVGRPGGVDILEGDGEARTVVEISDAMFEGLVNDLESPPGLIYGERVRCLRGDLMRLVRWDPALRAMFQGRPVYDAETMKLLERDGSPLDPKRSFRLADDPDELAHFMREAGYVVIRGVFSPAEVGRLLEQAEVARSQAVEGDQSSWWGKNAAGDTLLCRVLNAGMLPLFSDLHLDPRMLQLARIPDGELVINRPKQDNGVTVLFKNPDMVEGLSDLPWHRDCGMGGHAAMCPTVVATIYLTPGTSEAGELRVLPGSWRTSLGFIEASDPTAPHGVSISGQPGDVSLHYGDVMHVAPPPTGEGPYRICALVSFKKPGFRPHDGTRHYNDVLLGNSDGQIDDMRSVAERRSR